MSWQGGSRKQTHTQTLFWHICSLIAREDDDSSCCSQMSTSLWLRARISETSPFCWSRIRNSTHFTKSTHSWICWYRCQLRSVMLMLMLSITAQYTTINWHKHDPTSFSITRHVFPWIKYWKITRTATKSPTQIQEFRMMQFAIGHQPVWQYKCQKYQDKCNHL